VRANLAALDEHLARLKSVRRLEVEGGWYAVLRIPSLQPDLKTVHDLLDCGVWVQPGQFFGMPEAGWLVLSLLGPQDEFQEGLKILEAYFSVHFEGNAATSTIT
jgi:aspartate/methionine/tyrosine aminotransferase